MRVDLVMLFVAVFGGPVWANDRLVRVYADPVLVETGLLKYALPRFSLKTQVRVELVVAEAAQLVLGAEGTALFEGAGAVWHLEVRDDAHPGTARLADWLSSEIGQNTILSYAPEGAPLFAPIETVAVVEEVVIEGDTVLGREVSYTKCGRCHVTERGRGMGGIGSTPSFFVMRGFEDWEGRFAAFFILKPHPAFTQVDGITEPFPQNRPSPIAPVEMTLDEIDAMLAYVASLEPADLGAPLQHQ